ncbi:MAG TPA: IclR family transcriptional regulator [Acidimicrobiales bacterium]|nr:IclR family transcriptional regulator [Acidimicrobiales bacterium]
MQGLEPKYTVKSVEKAALTILILEREAGETGLSLTAIAEKMSMSKSSMFALLQTLAAYGFVSAENREGPNRYRLGLGLVRLGERAADQTTVAMVCRPELESLSAITRLTARAAVLNGSWAVSIARVDSPDPVRLDLRLGEREWPHRSGLGKALMSALQDAEVRLHLSEVGMPANTEFTITTVDDYLANLAISRQRGYCLDDEEDAEGIICIAAPVTTESGRPFAAISVTGVKTGQLVEDLEAVAKQVQVHAQRISNLLLPVESA